jgi:hypothetical protein
MSIDMNGPVSGIAGPQPAMFRTLELSANFPNPFNSSTRFVVRTNLDQMVTIRLFDILGREMETLLHAALTAGRHDVVWDASRYPSGIYVCRVESGVSVAVQRMVLIR